MLLFMAILLHSLRTHYVHFVRLLLLAQEKSHSNESGKLTSRLEIAKDSVLKILDNLNDLQINCGVTTLSVAVGAGRAENDDGSRRGLNFGLCAVVYEWARGKPFRDIMKMTTVHEGVIVRCITRLDELCKDFRNASKLIGNPSLYRKLEAASTCIKRDIVFASSMYIS